jgi:hypothetical protein
MNQNFDSEKPVTKILTKLTIYDNTACSYCLNPYNLSPKGMYIYSEIDDKGLTIISFVVCATCILHKGHHVELLPKH